MLRKCAAERHGEDSPAIQRVTRNNSCSGSGLRMHYSVYAFYKYKRIVPRADRIRQWNRCPETVDTNVVLRDRRPAGSEEFETPTFTIVKSTEALRYRNRHVAQRDLSEEEV